MPLSPAASVPTLARPTGSFGVDATGLKRLLVLSESRRGMKGEGEITMKALVIFTAVCFSTSAYAQDAPPKAGNKPLLQVRPKNPMGCKLVGRVKGTKLWAGDCVGPELRGAIPSTETQSVPEPSTAAIPPDEKQ